MGTWVVVVLVVSSTYSMIRSAGNCLLQTASCNSLQLHVDDDSYSFAAVVGGDVDVDVDGGVDSDDNDGGDGDGEKNSTNINLQKTQHKNKASYGDIYMNCSKCSFC